MPNNGGRRAWGAIALLADELRRRLYRFIRAQSAPVTREQAAAATGISTKLAAYHLDKLLAAGLLEAVTPDLASRPPGRGRTPKAYRPAAEELAVSLPQRHYDLLGDLLTQAIVADGPASPAWRAARQLAHHRGQALGERVRVQRRLGRLGAERAIGITRDLLDACGYQPVRTDAHQLVLSNCPFQSLAGNAPELICALNRDFVAGLLHGLRARRVDAGLDPAAAADPLRCCVFLQAA
ncbi:MAG: helix-turn-helix transcriptional regulator [Mycobacteriales bacterium]